MKRYTKIEKILFNTGMFLGVVGQLIWAIIFWNSDLFMHHTTVAVIGLVLALTGIRYPASTMFNSLFY